MLRCSYTTATHGETTVTRSDTLTHGDTLTRGDTMTHCYTTVTRGGRTVTLIVMQYSLLIQQNP